VAGENTVTKLFCKSRQCAQRRTDDAFRERVSAANTGSGICNLVMTTLALESAGRRLTDPFSLLNVEGKYHEFKN
jgi:hypothetical protein